MWKIFLICRIHSFLNVGLPNPPKKRNVYVILRELQSKKKNVIKLNIDFCVNSGNSYITHENAHTQTLYKN